MLYFCYACVRVDQPNPKDGRHVARVQSRHLSWPTDSVQFSPLPLCASKSNQFILPFVPTTRRRVERRREKEREREANICRLCRTVSGKRCHHTMPASCDGSGIEKGRGRRGKGKNVARSGPENNVAVGQELIEILRRRRCQSCHVRQSTRAPFSPFFPRHRRQ